MSLLVNICSVWACGEVGHSFSLFLAFTFEFRLPLSSSPLPIPPTTPGGPSAHLWQTQKDSRPCFETCLDHSLKLLFPISSPQTVLFSREPINED